MIGIYKIENISTGKCYIGQSRNIKRRKKDHFNALRRGDHHNTLLLEAFNKYGEEKFAFKILEKVKDISHLVEREIYWCNHFDSIENGYNLVIPTNCNYQQYSEELIISIREDYYSKKYTQPELGDKYNMHYSTICQIVRGNMYAHYGGPITKADGESFKKNKGHKLYTKDVKNIKKLLEEGKSTIFLAKQFNVSKETITSIKYGRSWTNVPGKIWSRVRKINELKEEDIFKIRETYNPGKYTYKQLADKFNINVTAVGKIVRGVYKPDVGGKIYSLEEIRIKNRLHVSNLSHKDISDIKKALNGTSKTHKDIAKILNVDIQIVHKISAEHIFKNIEPKINKARKKLNKSRRKSSHLCEEQVIEIKNLLNNTELTYSEIGKKFGVKRKAIADIKNGRSWKDIGPKVTRTYT